jgi:hypothetical protein
MKMEKVIAFDLEIVKDIPEGVEWRNIRPLGISCAALLLDETALSELHYHKEFDLPISGGMDKEELAELVGVMVAFHENNVPIITWNGLGFDFDVLAEESGMYEECKELALNHIDMMFHFFCMRGFPVGLDATAKGLGLGGKMAGMTGALAPELWRSDNLSDRLKVLRYVHQDAVSTLEVYEESSKRGAVTWVTKKGKYSTQPLYGGWKTVKECLELPLPDTSWMDTPINREDFYAWTEK